MIPFGRYLYFYKHCAETRNNKDMINESYLLLAIKDLRNAAAHNSCILNDLHPGSSKHPTSFIVTNALNQIDNTKHIRRKKMSNARIQQIVTLLYAHKIFVTSDGVHKHQCSILNDLIARMHRNIDYYADNSMITTTINFLKDIVDTWFSKEYNDIN